MSENKTDVRTATGPSLANFENKLFCGGIGVTPNEETFKSMNIMVMVQLGKTMILCL